MQLVCIDVDVAGRRVRRVERFPVVRVRTIVRVPARRDGWHHGATAYPCPLPRLGDAVVCVHGAVPAHHCGIAVHGRAPVPGGDEEGQADEEEVDYEDEADEARDLAVGEEGLEGEED